MRAYHRMQTMSAADKTRRINKIQQARFEAEVRATMEEGSDG